MTGQTMRRAQAGGSPADHRFEVVEGGLGWRRTGRLRIAGAPILDGAFATDGQVADLLLRLFGAGDVAARDRELGRLSGSFALIYGDDPLIAMVDRVCSIPVFRSVDGRLVSTHAPSAADRLGWAEIDRRAALAIAMSGYTIGEATLHPRLKRLMPGEAWVFSHTAPARRVRRFVYGPGGGATGRAPLAEVLDRVFARLAVDLRDRPILIPLSAGIDSRLVLCGLLRHGARDIRCMSYGRRDGFEVQTARRVAERLGVPWIFVPFDRRSQRRQIASAKHADYLSAADTLTATPFEQDFAAIDSLVGAQVPESAVVVNGQSGDFLTGNHIPEALATPAHEAAGQPLDLVFGAMLDKHYALWQSLKNADHQKIIREDLQNHLAQFGDKEVPMTAPYALYEALEYENRQSKYTLNGQMIYDFFGLPWRLPLWDDELIAWFAEAPLADKRRQRLYRETVSRLNWGDVWHDIPINRKTVRPHWVRPLRLGAKALTYPLGRRRWHAVERRVFGYFMEPLGLTGIRSWGQLARDGRGWRNVVSLLTEDFLGRHGLDYAGR